MILDRSLVYILVGALAASASGTAVAGGIHNPDGHYFSFADSPFAAGSAATTTFWLENFEDGALNTPGVSAIHGVILLRSDEFSDSVDADDGVIDNNGNTGGAITGARYSAGSFVLEFTFGAAALGGCLPTHVGLVTTDAVTPTAMTLAAYRGGVLLGSVSGNQAAELYHFAAQDRFYGYIDFGGIDRIVMTAATDSDWAMDHLQYGFGLASDPDFDDNGIVDGADLGQLLGEWGACAGCSCAADFNGDGQVDGADLGVLLGAWG